MRKVTYILPTNHRWLILAVLALAFIPVLLWLRSEIGDSGRPLKPIRPSATPLIQTVADGVSLPVSLAQLNRDPFALRDERIQVTGDYISVSRGECLSGKGPEAEWALVAEDSSLKAVGFENIVRMLSTGVSLTVEGILRAYEGPVGCGKAPPRDIVWYLEVDRILRPNPLMAGGAAVEFGTSGSTGPIPPVETPSPLTTAGPESTETVDPTFGTPEPTVTAVTTTTVTPALPTSPPDVATPVGTSDDGTQTVTPGAATVSPTPTSDMTPILTGTATSQPIGTGTPTRTATASLTRTPLPTSPPLSTATPGNGYPGPDATATSTPTPTLGAYP